MISKEPLNLKIREGTEEKQTLCLNIGEGRYFLVHRLSQIKKRNPQKEIRKRMKEIRRLTMNTL